MRTTISKDGTALAFDQAGRGEPIILIGGALADRSHPTLIQLAESLSPQFTVINYDRRGRGNSGDTQPYAVEREIEDIEALIKEARGSARVCAFSSGAALALRAAASGLALKKLALYEPPFRMAGNSSLLPQSFAGNLSELIAAGRRGDAVEYFMTQAAEIPAALVAQMRNEPIWPIMEARAHTLLYDTAIMGNDGTLPFALVSTITVPTLVIDGGESPAWMRDAARAVAEILPHAQRRTLPDQTHQVSPLVLVPILREFFKG